MHAAGISHQRYAAQSVAAHAGARLQIGLGPLTDGLESKVADHAEFQIQRVPLVVERHGGEERHLVLRAAPGLADRALTAEVRGAELDGRAQAVGVLALGHGAFDLLLQQPGRGVAHPELALERQGRQLGLGLADQVDRQNQDASASLVCSITLAAVSDLRCRQPRHWNSLRAPWPKTQFAAELHRGHRKPCGQRACRTALAHCALVPTLARNSGIDMPIWNWMWFVVMGRSVNRCCTAYSVREGLQISVADVLGRRVT